MINDTSNRAPAPQTVTDNGTNKSVSEETRMAYTAEYFFYRATEHEAGTPNRLQFCERLFNA